MITIPSNRVLDLGENNVLKDQIEFRSYLRVREMTMLTNYRNLLQIHHHPVASMPTNGQPQDRPQR